MDIRDIILEKVEYNEDFTAILPVAKAIDFIGEYVDFDKVEYMEEDFEELCDIMAISLVRNSIDDSEWYIEDAFYEDEIKYMESDVFFIDRDILEDIDMERLEGSIIIDDFYTELEDIDREILVNDDNYEEEICECCDSDEEDEIAFAIEEVVEDTLIELEDSECEWCSVEKAVRRGYSVGYANALRMMRDAIDEILEEYN